MPASTADVDAEEVHYLNFAISKRLVVGLLITNTGFLLMSFFFSYQPTNLWTFFGLAQRVTLLPVAKLPLPVTLPNLAWLNFTTMDCIIGGGQGENVGYT